MLLLRNAQLFEDAGSGPQRQAWLLVDGRPIGDPGWGERAPLSAAAESDVEVAGQAPLPRLINPRVRIKLDGSAAAVEQASCLDDQGLGLLLETGATLAPP